MIPFTARSKPILLIEIASQRMCFYFIRRGFIFCLISFSLISRPGSVVAIVQLLFENSTIDPLQPLQEEMSDGSLASIKVNPVLDVDPSILPTASSMCKQSINCYSYDSLIIVVVVSSLGRNF